MTSPTGGEHISRYRALGEFDNLIREANKARRALRELREEEAKLNAQSLADDKKVAASKADRAKAETASADAAKKATADLNKGDVAGKAGETAGTSYSRGMGRGIERGSQSPENRRFLDAATKALRGQFEKAGADSGVSFQGSFGKSLTGSGAGNSPMSRSIAQAFRDMRDKAGPAGQDTGQRYITGFASKIRDLNNILPLLGQDELNLDVDIKDAQQSMKALEFELRRLSNVTAEPRIRIDATRALTNLRAIQKLFKDEVAEDMVKESRRIQDELKVIDTLPSGKAFKFWALTALSDMSRVYGEANKGVGIFERLRKSIAATGSGGSGNYFRTVVTGFDEMSQAGSRLLQRLGRVSGELYRMPGIIAVLVSAIPALIAGIGALGAGALGAVSALGSLSGLLAAGPGVAFAFIGAIGGVSNALSGMGDILKNAREALDQEAEAKEKSRLGTEKALTAAQKYQLALRNLDPATQKVTESFVAFSTKYAEMQKRIGERFFKELADDTDRFNKVIPIAENFFGKSATAVGKLASEGLKMVTSGPWKRDFAIIAQNNASVIDNMGKAGFGLANVFRNIAVAAGPFTTWITAALKDGAEAFADWSAQARSDGTITDFLNETKESAQVLWQIMKNLGNIVNSFFQTTIDEGQNYLRTLESITQHWADVAEAQEAANSPLRQYMLNIRPVLSALGKLIADVARGVGGLAANQNNIKSMIDLLDSLRTKVLPPILDILQHLNDSGIAVTVVDALGTFLSAIAKFLDSGAISALTVFVTVLANFAEIVFGFASLPVISTALGGLASALAALAAVSIVARFTGLFRLWDFFTWMTRNRGNLSGAFADAARGAAGLNQVGGQQALPANVPSSVSSVGGIGSEVIAAQAKANDAAAKSANAAAASTGRFSTALRGLRAAGAGASTAMASAAAAIGPLGLAIGAATIALGYFMNQAQEQKSRVETLQVALGGLSDKYTELSRTGEQAGSSAEQAFREIVQGNPELQQTILLLNGLGLSFKDMVDATTSGDPSKVVSALDAEIAKLNNEMRDPSNFFQIFDNQKRQDKIDELYAAKDAFLANADALGVTTDATKLLNAEEERNQYLQNAFNTFIGPVSIGMREKLAQSYDNNAAKIDALQGLVNVLGNAESDGADKASALRKVIDSQSGAVERNIETQETWKGVLFSLSDAVQANGKSLSVNSREGLRNRDALQAAAKATRELYLQDIAAGVPMDEALKRHKARVTELQKEADKAFGTNKKTRELIKTYGDVPEDVITDLTTTGYAKVYQQMQDLKALQASLQSGKSLSEATREVEESKARAAAKGFGDGYGAAPGYRTGGPVWGQGTRTSDSIRAWLSNGEFVQPTDAVEHYGMPIMEALRTRKLDKAALNEALPDGQATNFANGGSAHSANCAACASGGHKFAQGGTAHWPYKVDASDTLIKKSWADQFSGGLGQGTGSGGVAWMMAALRKQFPGLPLISGFRRNSTTLSGNRSYHSLNRAVDLPPRRDVAQWIRSNYGAKTKELITPYNDLNLHNGRPHRYTGAIWNQHNFAGGNAHDHWAYNKGGPVDISQMLGMNNLMPQTNTALPTTPRSLSPAASSVVNNSTDNARTFGDVIINNPMPERAGDSIRDALYRTQLLL
jgi:hypothetical protein